MKLILLIIFTALIISTPSVAQISNVKESVGKLSGLVLDVSDARVPKARIIIEGKNFKREIKSNDEGYYEIWLPKGKYKIRIPEENGWYASAHKRVSIISNETFTHNFVLKGIKQDVNHP